MKENKIYLFFCFLFVYCIMVCRFSLLIKGIQCWNVGNLYIGLNEGFSVGYCLVVIKYFFFYISIGFWLFYIVFLVDFESIVNLIYIFQVVKEGLVLIKNVDFFFFVVDFRNGINYLSYFENLGSFFDFFQGVGDYI